MRTIFVRLTLIMLMISLGVFMAPKSFAINDFESGVHGFTVDADAYNVNWESRRTQNTYYQGNVTTTVNTYIGIARSKYVISDGRTVATVMVKSIVNPRAFSYTTTFLWITNHHTGYAIMDELSYTAQLTGFEMVDVDPKNTPSTNTYNIGVNAGLTASTANGGTFGGSLGISASTTFTVSALKITNQSISADGLGKTVFEYVDPLWRWEWERLSYAHYESTQRSAYTVFKSSTRQYKTFIINVKTDAISQAPNYWTDFLGFKSSSSYHASILI